MINKTNARGFTLVELMVSVTIALFLVGGAVAIVAKTKNTFVAQNQLAQLQDNERLVMTFIAQVVQSAGYYPNPAVNTNTSAIFPAVGTTFVGSQVVTGTGDGTSATGDTVSIRFAAGLNDNVYGCTGQANTAVNPYDSWTNKFSVIAATGTTPAELVCTFTNNQFTTPVTTTVPLATGVTQLVILYGVKRNAADTGSCADTYLNATQMTAADWNAVCSLKVTASFANPMTSTGLPVLPVTRVIAVMNSAGVNT